MSINRVTLIGHVGQPPEEKAPGFVVFSMATSEKYTDKNGQQRDLSEWHNITLNEPLASVALQYLDKGALVYIEGSIRNRKYTDKQGIERQATNIAGRVMQMLDRKSANNENRTNAYNTMKKPYQPTSSTPFVEDPDIPF